MTLPRAALRFAGEAPLDFPSIRAGVAGENEFLCVPVASQGRARFGEIFTIPAISREDAQARLERYIALDSPLGGLMSTLAPYAADSMRRARDTYHAGLLANKADWLAGGGTYNEKWKKLAEKSREQLRASVQKGSGFSRFEYELIDRPRLPSPKRTLYANGVTNRTGDEVFDTINASFKSNPAVDKVSRVSAKAARVLPTISFAVSAVELSTLAARVYSAADEKSEAIALGAFFREAGSTVGAVGGGALGSLVCATQAFGTSGVGIIGCGVIIGGASYAGSDLGVAAGELAFDLIGPSTMKLLSAIKSGSP